MNIGFGLSCYSVLFTSFKQNETVLSISDDILAQALNEDTWKFVLSYDKWSWRLSILEEIKEFLIVDLEEGAINSKLLVVLHTEMINITE